MLQKERQLRAQSKLPIPAKAGVIPSSDEKSSRKRKSSEDDDEQVVSIATTQKGGNGVKVNATTKSGKNRGSKKARKGT